MTCDRCQTHPIDGTGWPGEPGETLCQWCWEADCSRTWWEEYDRRVALIGEDT